MATVNVDLQLALETSPKKCDQKSGVFAGRLKVSLRLGVKSASV